MTGFARTSGRINDLLSWNLSLKSVNHRFLDLHMRMPAGAEPLEMRLRRLLKEKVLRGHLEVTLTVDRGLRPSAQFDPGLLQGYIAAFRAAATENGLQQQPDLNVIFRLPGVLTGEMRFTEEEVKALEEDVATELGPLVEALNRMRAQEGGALAALFAATYPQRCQQAVLYGAWARFPVPAEVLDPLFKYIDRAWGNGLSLAAFAPSRQTDPAMLHWWGRFERLGASPAGVTAADPSRCPVVHRSRLPRFHA